MGTEYRAERVDPAYRVQEYAPGHDGPPRRHLPPHAYEQPPRPTPHPTAADVASVLGLPASAVTPALLAAVAPLLAEIDRLHWVAEQAEHRAAWLDRHSDRHSVVPCLSRRAFVRELDSFLTGGDGHGTLALLQVGGIEALRRIHGLAAGEGALRHVAGCVLGAVRATDMVGCLGGSDFAVLLAGTSEEMARAKMEAICDRIVSPPFIWQDGRIALVPACGFHELRAGDSAEASIAAADLARRAQMTPEALT
ncbi:MAG TPA: diguanylate cyclase [Magnetospirillum sp.]|nr:diguanylate cyclase [Magnetospirillum sp.]